MYKNLGCKLNYADSVRPNMPLLLDCPSLEAVMERCKCASKLNVWQKPLDKTNIVWHNLIYTKICAGGHAKWIAIKMTILKKTAILKKKGV